ncbi:FAD-binding protein [Dongia soli]|uniref:FAD-binding protein n=1 Tax=Dongia soli TaxID=600628 RepID=A0ABU5E849_9PROT|nr:FAD-binding protein [Dongia soli]MDY0882522.1 FAD-binding protein [Dongia soli]
MTNEISPTSAADLADAVCGALRDKAPLQIVGQGSKAGWGRPDQAMRRLSLARFTGIRSYEAAELVMTVGAGTLMSDIEPILAAKNQQLAFEPADWGPLWGKPAGQGTIGGVLSCNLSGPRRFHSGAARDHFLGFTAVNGRGEVYKAGGPVVKNVTGYDLPKLLAGSFGTLSVLTDITVKVLPRPEKQRTVLLFGQGPETANDAMTMALGSTHDVSGACYLPMDLARRSRVDLIRNANAAVTALRIEGSGPSVEHRCAALRQIVCDAATEELHSMRSLAFWREIRDVATFMADPETVLWRLSVPPASGARLAGKLANALAGCSWFLDWGGGLLWIALPPVEDIGAEKIRQSLVDGGGHATLLRGPDDLRRTVPVIEPGALSALLRRVKQAFDPAGILNPGRLSADW